MEYKNHIQTGNSIIVVTNEGPVTINKSYPKYEVVKKALKDHMYAEVVRNISVKNVIKAETQDQFDVNGGVIVYKGETLPKVLSERILNFVENRIDVKPLVKFWQNLRRNPNLESRKDLYTFLESNAISITPEGNFIAYKAVRDDYMDHYSNTFDNHPGKVVSMPREQCDKDRSNTCSRGLHVAAYKYSWDMSGRLLEVEVNPRDVVAVPSDYSAMKMRVAKYTVLHDLDKQDDKESTDLVYNFRTYYYKGRKDRPFSERLVTSHKPSRFSLTCRAKTTEEATKKLEKMKK